MKRKDITHEKWFINWEELGHTDLAWDSAAIKHRTLRQCLIERRMGMDIDRIEPFISFEESLPKGSQKDWPFCQKHKCNLWGVFVRQFLNPRNHRSSPQQLFLCHVMHSLGWPRETLWLIWSKDGGFCLIVWRWDGRRKRRRRQRWKGEVVELKVEGEVFERESDDGDSNEQTRGKC